MVGLLIIDDNIDLIHVLREAVELSGFTVSEAHDGEAALAALNAGLQPAAILCDIALPYMDGLELLRQIRANPAWAQVTLIAMSGSTDKRKDALDAGADYYLAKPFSIFDLYTILSQGGTSE